MIAGCCGWGQAKPTYFEQFSTVELQDPFYEPPSIALAQKWRDLAPPSFGFCLKAWQLITHRSNSPTYRRLKSKLSPSEADLVGSFRPTEQVWLAWERTLGVARTLKARVIVFQCPKSFERTRDNLRNFRTFFSAVDHEDFLLAWEPRGDWPDPLVAELCSEFDLLHCVDPFERRSVHGNPGYWRLHGRGGYRYRYSDEELNELRGMADEREGSTYVMFNNIWMKDDASRFMQAGLCTSEASPRPQQQ